MNKFRNEGVKQYQTDSIDVFDLYLLMWKRYFDFEGTSTRREYWLTTLISVIISILFQFVIDSIFDPTLLGILVLGYGLFIFASIIPGTALMVRRFHDTGVSGWNYLWAFTGIGGIYVLYLLTREAS